MELSAWPTSPSAWSSSTERVSWSVRACSSLEQPRVLDGDGGLVGEGLHQGDLAVGERPDLVPDDRDHAEQLVRPEHGHRQHGPDGIDLLAP